MQAEVNAYLDGIEAPSKQEDARVLVDLFARVTGEEAIMWGRIIGFGDYETIYASGREVHCQRSGFATAKTKHSLHLMGGYCDEAAGRERAALLERLGKYKEGASCLYINKLADVDMAVLEEVIAADWAAMNRVYPPA